MTIVSFRALSMLSMQSMQRSHFECAVWAASVHPALQMLRPEESAFFPRVYVGMYTLFATLQATLPARAIYDDMDGIAEPVTPLGEQPRAWVRRRAPPCGLEAHDHP